MKTEAEIRELFVWLKMELSPAIQDKGMDNPYYPPTTMPEPGYIYDGRQALDVLKWVLDI